MSNVELLKQFCTAHDIQDIQVKDEATAFPILLQLLDRAFNRIEELEGETEAIRGFLAF